MKLFDIDLGRDIIINDITGDVINLYPNCEDCLFICSKECISISQQFRRY